MKKILVDGRLLSNKPTGISRYTNEVIQALLAHYGSDNISVLIDAEYNNIGNYNIIRTRLKPYNPIHYLLFSFFVYCQDFHVYYSTFYSGIYFTGRKKKQVITIHDLMYRQITNYFSTSTIRNILSKAFLNFILRSSLHSCKLIITVSKTTKNDLWRYFRIDSVVISEGVNYLDENPSSIVNIFNKLKIEKGKYFLYVGNFRKQKNISFLIEAFILSNTSCQLVLVGENNSTTLKHNKIIFAGVLNDCEIQKLYKNCLAFVMPSLYEGFGLPILEAYSAGARVLSSNQGALTEFHDLAITYFSPYNVNELVYLFQNIEKIQKPTQSEIDLIRKKYSWKNQTDRIIDCIESLNSR